MGLKYETLIDDLTTILDEKFASSTFGTPKNVRGFTGKKQNYSRTDNSYSVVPGHHVTTDSGTGVVHIAPAFGEDDFQIGKAQDLGFFSHIDDTGHTENLKEDRNGRYVFDFNEDVIQELKDSGKLAFPVGNIVHSYPHCWRTDVPLIYKAVSAWYVKIEDTKEGAVILGPKDHANKVRSATSLASGLLRSNADTSWTPDSIKDGRFGKWLEGARDWNLSRNRYWGSAIPVWKTADGAKQRCVGSMEELFQLNKPFKQVTKVILVRHGHTDYNARHMADCWPADKARLDEKGLAQAQALAERLKGEHIDAVYCSPLTRCQQTIAPLATAKGMGIETVHDLRELDVPGIQDQVMDWWSVLKWDDAPIDGKGGPSEKESYERTAAALKDIVRKNGGKTVVICTHGDPTIHVQKALADFDYDAKKRTKCLSNAQDLALYAYADESLWTPAGIGVDLHKHLVDRVKLAHPETGEEMVRVPEVLDCWFESGSMPYAGGKERFAPETAASGTTPARFPAQFIAEGLDQTRGWFYVLTVLGTALFGRSPFENVVVNGLVLAQDGQKMSKSKKNYPDPMELLEKHGADALRLYLMDSPVTKAQDLRFSEKGVEETLKKITLPLWNALSFFTTYANVDGWEPEPEVLFVRHGEIDANRDGWAAGGEVDQALNEKGRAQAQALARTLAASGRTFDVIVTSPLARARETADELAKAFPNAARETVDDLREINFGAAGLVGHDGIRAKLAAQGLEGTRAQVREWLYENADEKLDGFVARVDAAWKGAMARHAGKRVLVVAHGVVARALGEKLLGVPRGEAFGATHGVANCGAVDLPRTPVEHELDRWIASETQGLTGAVTAGLESYDLQAAASKFAPFLESLTNWYVRRSRRRFWADGLGADKRQAYATLHRALETFCRLLAPFAPFVADRAYRDLTGGLDVHLAPWPADVPFLAGEALPEKVARLRDLVSLGLAWRGAHKIRVRQPLAAMSVPVDLDEESAQALREEVNVKRVDRIADVAALATVGYAPDAGKIGKDPARRAAMKEILAKAKAGDARRLADGTLEVALADGGTATLAADEYQVTFEKKPGVELSLHAGMGLVIAMDDKLTPELLDEGYARDLVREIQDLRKKAGYAVDDRVLVTVEGPHRGPVDGFRAYLEEETLSTLVAQLPEPDAVAETDLGDGIAYRVTVKKA